MNNSEETSLIPSLFMIEYFEDTKKLHFGLVELLDQPNSGPSQGILKPSHQDWKRVLSQITGPHFNLINDEKRDELMIKPLKSCSFNDVN